ncbi:hypothetical protein [Mycolicibacterium mengxianglii]|uniref:hypothetical protein n=1 Tax=Mycolicibacterium mengxianglii TaxID=2736649 RepID=UPI0018D11146|nr:hypothetical protein [Mycolicibacterium mengxianglii]
MPRVSESEVSPESGVRVPGVYQAMLERERGRHRHGPRLADPSDPSKGFFLRPDGLLRALEAGEPVVVSTIKVGHKYSDPPVRWPWDARAVLRVQVSSDDRIKPAP